MNVHDLFKADGLKTFLFQYHQLLHTRYKFQPLSGLKSMHRAAEVLQLPSGEALQGVWGQHYSSSIPPQHIVFREKPISHQVAERYRLWAHYMRQQQWTLALHALGLACITPSDALICTVKRGLVLRREHMASSALNAFMEAIQRTESRQHASFAWSNACMANDDDNAVALGVALISLAGMQLERRNIELGLMYLQRWVSICSKTPNLSPTLQRLANMAKTHLQREGEQSEQLSVIIHAQRVSVVNEWYPLLEMIMCQEGVEDLKTAARQESPVYHLNRFSLENGVRLSMQLSGMRDLEWAILNQAVFIGTAAQVHSVIRYYGSKPALKAHFVENPSVAEILRTG